MGVKADRSMRLLLVFSFNVIQILERIFSKMLTCEDLPLPAN